jgi:flavorubredoxin
VIAPSHGLIWRENTDTIVSLYKKWAEYAAGPSDPGITLLYGSMYGHTEAMMNAVAHGISRAGVPVDIYDAARTHISYILPSLWTQAGVMIGAPTYEVSLFPPVADALTMAARKHIKRKKAAYFGSYSWSGGALRGLKSIIEPLKWELIDSLEFIGSPESEDLKRAEVFGRDFAEKIKKQ